MRVAVFSTKSYDQRFLTGITSHQAFFTQTALRNIAETTMANLEDYVARRSSPNEIKAH
jgi:lactate dehydrogenase-like 2-hydroxyacid dehydrogenase